MTRRRPHSVLVSLLILWPACGWAAQEYSVSGLVLAVNSSARTLTVSCKSIPGFMEAMTMSYSVRDSKELDGLQPGTMVDFTLVVDKWTSHAEQVRIRPFESDEQEPLQARRLALLQKVLRPSTAATQPLAVEQTVPDFTLKDQTGRPVSLHEFAGKIVALNFVYTRCPLPDNCFRFSTYFGRLQERFAERMGRDFVLLTVSFDPVHDLPEVLANYAKTWKANPASWHFLTGSTEEVGHVCRWFGVQAWSDEALLTHTQHTVLIGRNGKLVANVEGNQFSAEQLGDLVEAVMNTSPK